MERMAEVVPDADDQVLQHFLTHSRWNAGAVMTRVARQVDHSLGGTGDSALYLDESAFKKSGAHSVGVARQWNGRLGKIENSQVGVFAALGKGERVGLIDARLYLPQAWSEDGRRCAQAGIPPQCRRHQTKLEIALAMVRHARRNGVRFQWVGMDSLYGNAPWLLRALDADGEVFVADVHKNQHIYLEDPQPYLPRRKRAWGRPVTRHDSHAKPIAVGAWVKRQQQGWKKKILRNACRGRLEIEVLHQRVWIWEAGSEQAHQWHLIVRREIDAPHEIKYSLSNAPASTSVLRLAKMQGQRYWIERAFQDAKSHVGMAQYQARKWNSWHRHMALVMMAGLFMLQQRIAYAATIPLLSCYDIQILLARTLPTKQANADELLRQLEERHRRRQRDMDSKRKRQQRKVRRQEVTS